MKRISPIGCLLIAILSAIVIISLTYVLLFFPTMNKSENPNVIWVNIQGSVELGNASQLLDNNLAYRNRPLYVFVFRDHLDLNRLCEGGAIAVSEIEWLNKTYGKYSIQFNIPIEMDLVITTNCGGCYNERFKVMSNQTHINHNLYWDERGCNEEFEVLNNSRQQIERMDNILVGLNRLIDWAEVNISEKEMIRTDVTEALEYTNQAKKGGTENETLLLALRSEWVYQKVVYMIGFSELENKTMRFVDLLKTYNNSLCYVPDFEAYNYYKNLNWTYSYRLLERNDLKRDSPENYNDFDTISREIKIIHRDAESVSDVNYEFSSNYNQMKDSFIHQAGYCNQRSLTLSIFSKVFIVSIFLFGLILGIWVEKKYKLCEKASKWFNGRKIAFTGWLNELGKTERKVVLFLFYFFVLLPIMVFLVFLFHSLILYNIFRLQLDFNTILTVSGALDIAIVSSIILKNLDADHPSFSKT